MAASPDLKVYTESGEYVAACKIAEDAARIVAGRNGMTIRTGHRFIVWTEGNETFSASESYDGVAEVIYERTAHIRQRQAEIHAGRIQ